MNESQFIAGDPEYSQKWANMLVYPTGGTFARCNIFGIPRDFVAIPAIRELETR